MKAGRVQGATLKKGRGVLCVQRLWEVKIQSVDLVTTEVTGEQSRAVRRKGFETRRRPIFEVEAGEESFVEWDVPTSPSGGTPSD